MPGARRTQGFRFLFPDAERMTPRVDMTTSLDALAAAMTENDPDRIDNSGIPPIYTYFGQFIDHDVTANTEREEGDALERFNIDRADLDPLDRDDVERSQRNVRRSPLDLDTVYGDGPDQSDAELAATQALVDAQDPAKLRVGRARPIRDGATVVRPLFPVDDGADLPRYGAAFDEGLLTRNQVATLLGVDPESGEDAHRRLRRAAHVGDSRNDENLIVAQLHLSFLRLHNAIVDTRRDQGDRSSPAELFNAVRQEVRRIYQWLVVEIYLPTVCDPEVIHEIRCARAPVYSALAYRHANAGKDRSLPMPLEFSLAAFRFGHSMVRAEYDFNVNFGRQTGPSDIGRAGFEQLFRFTGGGDLGGNEVLPAEWIIDWARFTNPDLPDRVARKIDTHLALPLARLANVDPGANRVLTRLAARNLRRGYLFNVPSAQAVLRQLADEHGVMIDPLTENQLTAGRTGAVVRREGFYKETPLWFYVLLEAEAQADGEHLGQLGSRIVGETLIGLLVNDPASYLNEATSWTARRATIPIDSFASMLRAADLLPDSG